MKREFSDLAKEVQSKTAEVLRLETLLAPFRTIALERYTAPEAEALRKLADQISELQKANLKKDSIIEDLEGRIRDIKRDVAPRSISPEKAAVLSAKLQNKKGSAILVVSRIMDGEASDYADHLVEALQAAGWSASKNTSLLDDKVGLSICSYMSDSKLPGHDLLKNALNKSSIPCRDDCIRVNSISAPRKATLLLVVGRKERSTEP